MLLKASLSLFRHLYFQVVIAICLGIALGHFVPDLAVQMKPLGDAFIKLIKMVIAPIIFCTIVTGIAGTHHLKQAGTIGGKALIYFVILSLVALLLGMVVANVMAPGSGMQVDVTALQSKSVEHYIGDMRSPQSWDQFILHMIPSSVMGAFVTGEILPVLFIAIIFAIAITLVGIKAKPVLEFIDSAAHIFFKLIGLVMHLAPIGAFGAIAFTVGQQGIASLISLGQLLLCFYAACFLFIFVILALLLRYAGLNIFQFLRFIKEELLIVLATSSSETVFPRMLDKLTALGCDKTVVGIVLPTGYSFNLDGTAIYLSMATIFLAQAIGTPLSVQQQLVLLAVMLVSSKGAAGVTGTGFVMLATTLSMFGQIPVASVALILGIDRFMSEGRSLTNLVGNGVATIVIAKWQKMLNLEQAKQILSRKQIPPALETD